MTTDGDGRVSRLVLSSNNLTGQVPDALGHLSHLTDLVLRENRLTGRMPNALGDLGNLTGLNLYDNDLTGAIPTALGNLRNLERMRLDYNQLTGAIPPALGNLVNMSQLLLRSNALTGPIPAALNSLTELSQMSIDSDTDLCLETGFTLASAFARLARSHGLSDCATGTGFTDDPIVAGETPIRVVHFTELRARIDGLRATQGLDQLAWTDPTLAAGVVPVKGIHVSEIRTALRQVYDAARRSPAFDTAAVQAGSEIRAQHVNEVRRAVEILDGGGSPSATFDIAPSGGGMAGLTQYRFDASGLSGPADGRLTYTWRFGDGGTGTGVSATHIYAAPGTYSVTLTTVNDGQNQSATTGSVTVARDLNGTFSGTVHFNPGTLSYQVDLTLSQTPHSTTIDGTLISVSTPDPTEDPRVVQQVNGYISSENNDFVCPCPITIVEVSGREYLSTWGGQVLNGANGIVIDYHNRNGHIRGGELARK